MITIPSEVLLVFAFIGVAIQVFSTVRMRRERSEQEIKTISLLLVATWSCFTALAFIMTVQHAGWWTACLWWSVVVALLAINFKFDHKNMRRR